MSCEEAAERRQGKLCDDTIRRPRAGLRCSRVVSLDDSLAWIAGRPPASERYQGYMLSAPNLPANAEADIVGHIRRGENVDTRSMREIVNYVKFLETKDRRRKQKKSLRLATAKRASLEEQRLTEAKAEADAATEELVQLLADRLGADARLFAQLVEKATRDRILSINQVAQMVVERADV